MARHAIHTLADDVLLVFKPAGHREAEHRHDFSQHLRVVRGRLLVQVGASQHDLTPASPELTLAPGTPHATLAVSDTWVLARRSHDPRATA